MNKGEREVFERQMALQQALVDSNNRLAAAMERLADAQEASLGVAQAQLELAQAARTA